MTRSDQPELNAANREEHVRLAVEQSAMHAAHLAISRWSSGYCQCEAPLRQSQSPQSRWHAAAQSNFTVWLAAGGFAQVDAEAEPDTAESRTAGPAAAIAPRPGRRKTATPSDSAGHCSGICTV